MRRTIAAGLGILTLTAIGTVPVSAQETHTVHAGRLLDVESGTYRTDALIRIVDGRVQEISDARDLASSEELIDLSRYTVLPGLIDAHTHLCDNSYMGEAYDPWTLPAANLGIVGTVNAATTLHAGFTTVRNVSEPFYGGVALRDAIAKGWIEGPRMFVSGPMITMTGGHGNWGAWIAPDHLVDTPADMVADGTDEMRKAARTLIKYKVDLIKLSATGGFGTYGSIPGAATYTVEEMQAAVEEAAKRGLTVAAHAHGEQGILNAVAAGVRSVEHAAFLADESIEKMRDHGVFLVMDLLAAHYDLIETNRDMGDKEIRATNDEFYRQYAARFSRAYRAGVRMAFGTDAGVYPHGRNAEQFALMVDAGMEPIDAIRSATLWAAELLGIEDDAGSLQQGAWADLIAVRADPLMDVRALSDVRFVMKEGVVVKNDTSARGAGSDK